MAAKLAGVIIAFLVEMAVIAVMVFGVPGGPGVLDGALEIRRQTEIQNGQAGCLFEMVNEGVVNDVESCLG